MGLCVCVCVRMFFFFSVCVFPVMLPCVCVLYSYLSISVLLHVLCFCMKGFVSVLMSYCAGKKKTCVCVLLRLICCPVSVSFSLDVGTCTEKV